MTDSDVEAVLRAAFRSREHLVDGAGEHLAPAVRVRVRRRRRALPAVAAGAATLLVLGGLTAALSAGRGGGPAPAPAPEPAAEPGRVAPSGWRLESSAGIEIMVPATWATNDFGCGMTDKSSVVRGQTAVMLCLTPEPVTKEVAIIGPLPPESLSRLPESAVSIDGVAATRASGRLADGRYAGYLIVPSEGVGVDVRTRSEATTRAILDSARVVDVDHVGCATDRPARPSLSGGSDASFVPSDPESVGICYYGEKVTDADRLLASARLTGDTARRLAAALNAARPGGNPDRPADQCAVAGTGPPAPDAILLFPDATVAVTFSACTGRAAYDGARRVQVTRPLVDQITTAVGTGAVIPPDLPN